MFCFFLFESDVAMTWTEALVWKWFHSIQTERTRMYWCHWPVSSPSPPSFILLLTPPSPPRTTPRPPHTHTSLPSRPAPPPPQVSVPAVLQRRPDAVGELGLQHGGPPAPCAPPGQHHAARQPAGPAVGGRAPPLQQHQGAPPVFFSNSINNQARLDKLLDSALRTRQFSDPNQRTLWESASRRRGGLVVESPALLLHYFFFLLFFSRAISLRLLRCGQKRGGFAARPPDLAWIDSFLRGTELWHAEADLGYFLFSSYFFLFFFETWPNFTPVRTEALTVCPGESGSGSGGVCEGRQSVWHAALMEQTRSRTLQGLLTRCFCFGVFFFFLNGDTGLNPSPPLLPEPPPPRPPHSHPASCLVRIRWTLTWNCLQLLPSSVRGLVLIHLYHTQSDSDDTGTSPCLPLTQLPTFTLPLPVPDVGGPFFLQTFCCYSFRCCFIFLLHHHPLLSPPPHPPAITSSHPPLSSPLFSFFWYPAFFFNF